jgi:hypothetical protein
MNRAEREAMIAKLQADNERDAIATAERRAARELRGEVIDDIVRTTYVAPVRKRQQQPQQPQQPQPPPQQQAGDEWNSWAHQLITARLDIVIDVIAEETAEAISLLRTEIGETRREYRDLLEHIEEVRRNLIIEMNSREQRPAGEARALPKGAQSFTIIKNPPTASSEEPA